MRIPSEFNDENLYRRRAMRSENGQAYRKLIRLVLGLALVLVIMQQAARPEIYQVFFGPPGSGSPVRLGEVTVAGQGAMRPDVAESASLAAPTVDAADRAVAQQLMEPLKPSDQVRWLVCLSRWQRGRPAVVPSTLDSVRETLESLPLDGARRQPWDRLLRVLEDSPQNAVDEQPGSARPSAVTSGFFRWHERVFRWHERAFRWHGRAFRWHGRAFRWRGRGPASGSRGVAGRVGRGGDRERRGRQRLDGR